MNVGWRWSALKNGLQDATVYRGEFLMEVLGSAAVPAAIQWVLWGAMYRDGGAQIAGSSGAMTYSQMIAYTLTSILFTQVRGGNLDFELQELIRSGGLSQYLLRPASVIEFIYLRGSASRFFVATLSLGIGLLLCTFTRLEPLSLLAAMSMALLGNLIHYQLGAILSTVAFLWEEAYSLLMVKNLIVSILCGELIPLFLFPSHLSWVWESLPFYLYVFGPTQVALGEWSLEVWQHHIWIGLAWSLGLGLATHLTWRLGIHRYQSLGG
jgi:ABC-type uncharacterized transport system permease subunit